MLNILGFLNGAVLGLIGGGVPAMVKAEKNHNRAIEAEGNVRRLVTEIEGLESKVHGLEQDQASKMNCSSLLRLAAAAKRKEEEKDRAAARESEILKTWLNAGKD